MLQSTRPHIAKIQRYERRRAKALAIFDKALDITFYTVIGLVIWATLVIITI